MDSNSSTHWGCAELLKDFDQKPRNINENNIKMDIRGR
jgi:hypothetical protein